MKVLERKEFCTDIQYQSFMSEACHFRIFLTLCDIWRSKIEVRLVQNLLWVYQQLQMHGG